MANKPKPISPDTTIRSAGKPACAFCGKDQDKVRLLIAGPTVFICDECIDLCVDIVRGEHAIVVTIEGLPGSGKSTLRKIFKAAIAQNTFISPEQIKFIEVATKGE